MEFIEPTLMPPSGCWERELLGGEFQSACIGPELFETVEIALLLLEDMDHHVEIVHQNPFGIVVPLQFGGIETGGFLHHLMHMVAE